MTLGYQWVDVQEIKRTLHISPPTTDQIRAVDNQMWPVFLARLSRVTSNPPNFGVRPASLQTDDQQSADLACDILRYLWDDTLEGRKKLRELYAWVLLCGNAFLNLQWNPEIGPRSSGWRVKSPETGRSEIRLESQLKRDYGDFTIENGMAQGPAWNRPVGLEELGWEQTEVAQGEQELTVESPFSVFPDPMAQSLNQAQWVLIVKAMSLEQLYDFYGDEAKYVTPEREELYASSMEKELNDIFLGSINVLSQQSKQPDSEKGHYVLVKQMQTRPDPRKKEKVGRIVTLAGGRILANEEMPYEHARKKGNGSTLFHFRELCMPGQFWGRSTQEQLIPTQKRINIWWSQILEAHDKVSHYTWLIPTQCNMAKPSNRVRVHYYDPDPRVPTRKPEVMTPPSLPADRYTVFKFLENHFQTIAGTNDVMLQGAPPSGVKSGVAIAALEQQDVHRLSPMLEDANDEWIRLGKCILANVRQYYSEPRTMRTFSEDRKMKVRQFKGSDLLDSYDVIIETRTPYPRNLVAKQEQIRQDFLAGVFGRQDDPGVLRHVRKLMEYGEEAIGFSPDEEDEQEALGENASMEEGGPAEVISWQNHAIHMAIHRGLILSGRFKRLPPAVQEYILAHAKRHGDMLIYMHEPSTDEVIGDFATAGGEQVGNQLGTNSEPGSGTP